MTDRLDYLGITRRSAPPAARERLRGDEDTLRKLLERLGAAFPGRLVLATCERFELYTVSTEITAGDAIAILSDHAAVSADELARHADFRSGRDAARHLLRVAGGLESRVLGESHILGQVRRAYLLASETGSLDPRLFALGRAAIHTGKRIRTETTINRAARSLVTFAVDHVRRGVGTLRNKTVLIVGAGTLANDIVSRLDALPGTGVRGAAQAKACSSAHDAEAAQVKACVSAHDGDTLLTGDRPAELIVVSRHVERAHRLAARLGGTGVSPEDMAWALDRADVVIGCAAAGSFLIRPGDIHPSRTKPLYLLDLGVPRNVDPACAERRCVELAHLDDLPCRTNEHRSCLRRADRIIEQELARHLKWQRARSVSSLLPYQSERQRVASLPPYQGGIEEGLTTHGNLPQPFAESPSQEARFEAPHGRQAAARRIAPALTDRADGEVAA